MADVKTAPASPKAQTAPTTHKGGDAKVPVAGDAPKKEKKTSWKDLPAIFATSEEAVKAASARDSGPRRAFKVDLHGKTYFVVSHNFMTVGTPLLHHLGGTAEEIGKAPRAPKAVTADSVTEMLKTLLATNPAEAERVKEQLKALGITK